MKLLIRNLACVCLLLSVSILALVAADAPASPTVVFPDKQLEAAVRKCVFDKRDNDKPLTESDVVNISTIQGNGLGIADLTGLEKCQNLASLDLAKNKITDLSSLKNLAKIQYLNLADNQIQDIMPLAGVVALQYIELSRNRVKDLQPLQSLTNLASLYLSHNQISDISPIVKLPRLTSLYLDNNHLKSIDGLGQLRNLSSLSLNNNRIADIKALEGLNRLYFLFLENNKIRDLTPLVSMAKKDREQSFAAFLNLYLRGNPLSSAAKGAQIAALKETGMRVNN